MDCSPAAPPAIPPCRSCWKSATAGETMDLAHPIERHSAFAPNKVAIRFAGEDLGYAALAGRVRQACGRLTALDIAEGDVFAYLGFNHPEMLVLLFACARLRAILLPLNWRLATRACARAGRCRASDRGGRT